MADPAIGIDRSTDTAPYSPFVTGDRSGADRGVRSMAQSNDLADAHKELAALIQLGTERADAGADADATECFRRALEIGERTLSQDNPDLILLLNDLTRLYLKQSRYADAEPLLLRLFDLKRSKGDEHPEVATVLASLAGVRQALGQHESAEQLWRRVLDIRERTLAPNHFAIATALEHLGDACAARGNIAEALPALQRALTIRERTLGAGHPSLRTSKERIADLQLQSAEDPFDVTAGRDVFPSAEKYRLLSAEHVRITPAAAGGVALVRETAAAPPPPPRDFGAQMASRQANVILQLPSSEPILSDVTPSREVAAEAQSSGRDTLPYLDALETIRSKLEESETATPFTVRFRAIAQRATAVLARREVIAGIVVLVVSVFSVAVAKTRASTNFDVNAASNAGFAPADAGSRTVPALTASALATPIGESSAEAGAPSGASKLGTKPHADDRASSKKSEESKPDTRKLTLPTLSKSVMSNLDSLASRAAASTADRSDPVITMPASSLGTRRATFETSDPNTGPTRALLIGELPTPKIPEQAADVEGEVRVRFSVDARGEPVMSTFAVISSPNPLLTAAVRKVIPSMRFVPARTGGADPKPIADVVETGFRFARQNR